MHGRCGSVHVITSRATGDVHALKVFEDATEYTDDEVRVLKALLSDELPLTAGIVRYHGHFKVPWPASNNGLRMRRAIVMDYVAGEDMFDFANRWWRSHTEPPDARVVRRLLTSALRGLAYIHARGIAHCDVKPENLRVVGDADRVVLLDFGFSCSSPTAACVDASADEDDNVDDVDGDSGADGNVLPCCSSRLGAGTPCYLSPERAGAIKAVLAARQYQDGSSARAATPPSDGGGGGGGAALMRASDVWALAMSFYTLLTARASPGCQREDELKNSCMSPRAQRDLLLTYLADLHEFVPPLQLGSLYAADSLVDRTLCAMLVHDWRGRPTAAEALRLLLNHQNRS